MTFKDWWNKTPYWLKGGIIGFIVGYGLAFPLLSLLSIILPPAPGIVAMSMFFIAVFGAIIGIMFGLFKAYLSKNTKLKPYTLKGLAYGFIFFIIIFLIGD